MRAFLSGLLAALVLLTASCGSKNTPLPDSKPAVPGSSAVSEKKDTPSDAVRSGIQFAFTDLDDYAFTMMYEPRSDAKTKMPVGLNIPRDYDCEWLGDTEFDSHYNIFEYKTKEELARVRINTAPPDLEAFFKTEDRARIRELMRPSFYPVEDVYTGLKKAVVEDFEYKLITDWTGTAYGWNAFFIEFVDEDTNTHALRFYTGNDAFDEAFYAFEYRADLPADDAAAIALAKDVLFSLHPMDQGTYATQ